MPVRFKHDPSVGQYGIYTVPSAGSTDDAPLTNPHGNLSRTIVHPLLRYPGVVTTLSGTLNLPAASGGTFTTERRTHTLGAHGQVGRPMLIGRFPTLGVGGASVPWAGTVCVQCPAISWAYVSPPNRRTISVSRWLSLGVQGGNVVCYEQLRGTSGAGPGSMSIDYEVLILDRDLSASLPTSGPTEITYDGDEIVMRGPYGTVSSGHRYLKDGAGYGSTFALSGGRTTTIEPNDTVGGNIVNETTFNHSFGSGVYEVIVDTVIRTGSPSNTTGDYRPADAVNPVIKQVAL